MKRYLFLALITICFIGSCSQPTPEKVTISWWQFWTDVEIKPVIQEMIDDFEAEHKNVSVELVDLTWADGHDKISIAFSSGSGPDVVELGSDWIPEFSSTGHLLDISSMINFPADASDTGLSLRDNYLMWNPAEYNGKIFAFPWILGTRVLFSNSTLLKRAGYKPDFKPRNWSSLLGAAHKINTLDENIYGFGSNAAERHRLYKKFLPFLWSNGGSILSENNDSCLLTAPESVKALEYYLKLCSTGLTDTQRRLEDAFLNGEIGFIISGDWLLKRIANEKPDFNFSTALVPGPTGLKTSSSFAGGEYLAINKKSQHPEMAMALIKYICAPKNQIRFCLKNRTANPSSKIAVSDSLLMVQPHFDTFIRQLESAKMPPVHPQWVYMEGHLEKAIEAALYRTKSPRQALNDAAVSIEKLLSE